MSGNDTNDAIKVITATIKTACERLIAKAQYDRTVRGVVIAIPNDNSSSYTVRVGGGQYEGVPNYSGKKLFVGKSVWVTIPCNNYANMFIIAAN